MKKYNVYYVRKKYVDKSTSNELRLLSKGYKLIDAPDKMQALNIMQKQYGAFVIIKSIELSNGFYI